MPGLARWFARSGAASAAALVGACSVVESTSTDRFAATGELVALSGGGAGAANACFTCHGLAGDGDGAGVPRLASLNVGYLESQLEAYADGRRRHEQMEWIAGRLSAAETKRVAAYYAAMPYPAEGALPRPAPLLYVAGDADRGLPACASCHGLMGEGIGPANPPLGGQPAAYLYHQLEEWRRGKRRSDAQGMMLRISQLLTPRESEALAAYAARLPGGPPSPAPPEASPEAHRAGPRNDALEPLLHVPESGRATE